MAGRDILAHARGVGWRAGEAGGGPAGDLPQAGDLPGIDRADPPVIPSGAAVPDPGQRARPLGGVARVVSPRRRSTGAAAGGTGGWWTDYSTSASEPPVLS